MINLTSKYPDSTYKNFELNTNLLMEKEETNQINDNTNEYP
jgi:hypothetical protein